jgi:hypothetical protein
MWFELAGVWRGFKTIKMYKDKQWPSGLWNWYTKPLTQIPQFLNLLILESFIKAQYVLIMVNLLKWFSASVQTGPGAHPATCTVGTGSFRG